MVQLESPLTPNNYLSNTKINHLIIQKKIKLNYIFQGEPMSKKAFTMILILSSSMFLNAADEGQGGQQHDPARFEKMKSMMVENHQKRIGVLNNGISCINSAQDPKALKACHDAEKSAMEQIKSNAEAQRDSLKR
jgi:hypothetical protein